MIAKQNWYHLKSSVHTEVVRGEQYKGLGDQKCVKLNAKGLCENGIKKQCNPIQLKAVPTFILLIPWPSSSSHSLSFSSLIFYVHGVPQVVLGLRMTIAKDGRA